MNFSILFVLGISIFGGLIGASFFQRARIPQVVGYIVIGFAAGQSGLGLIDREAITALEPFTLFALGIIGFLVGAELEAENFRKYAKQFFFILLGEGLGAFVLVGVGTGLLLYSVFHDAAAAVAAGVVFGAIASATDPASTIDVLWEYRARGVLTTSLTAVVALDDALAMTLYGLGTGAAQVLAGTGGSVVGEIGKVTLELFGAVFSGAACALILRVLLQRIRQAEKAMALVIAVILLLISLASYLDMDVILTSMTLGCVLVNTLHGRSRELFGVIRSFSTPIYVLFFVLAGARLGISHMPAWLWVVVALYVVARSAGKMVGVYAGGRFSGSAPAVRRYLGLGLFAQGGVAIGLSIMASRHLSGVSVAQDLSLGDVVVFGVAATTFIVQLSGPPMVKLAIRLSGEAGRNVTRDDVVDSWTVGDVMEKDILLIPESEPLVDAARTFMENDYQLYPVVDGQGNVLGVMSLQSLKNVLVNQDSWVWLLASDVMEPIEQRFVPEMPLREALKRMNDLGSEQVLVVQKGNGTRPVGILDRGRIRQLIDKEVVRRQKPAPAGQSGSAKEHRSRKGPGGRD